MKYYVTRLTGAMYLELTWKGETFSKWVVNGDYMDDEAESLVDQVIELFGERNCKELRDEMYRELEFEFVERCDVPPWVEEHLIQEESYLVDESMEDY